MILCSRSSVEYLQENLYNLGLKTMGEDRKWPYEPESKFLNIKHNLRQEKEPTQDRKQKQTKIKWQLSHQKQARSEKGKLSKHACILDGVIPRSYSTCENSFLQAHNRVQNVRLGVWLWIPAPTFTCVPLGKWFNRAKTHFNEENENFFLNDHNNNGQ